MPDEIAHDASYDDAGEELDRADGVEGEAGVVRRCRFGTAVERVEHGVSDCMCVCIAYEGSKLRRVRVGSRRIESGNSEVKGLPFCG